MPVNLAVQSTKQKDARRRRRVGSGNGTPMMVAEARQMNPIIKPLPTDTASMLRKMSSKKLIAPKAPTQVTPTEHTQTLSVGTDTLEGFAKEPQGV